MTTILQQNLSNVAVNAPMEVMDRMKQAGKKRVTDSTAMNAVSCRSDVIFTLLVTVSPAEDEEAVSEKLTLVDLADSDRIKRRGAEGYKYQ